MKSCLVTGATGFIGRHVVRELLDKGWQVVATARALENPFPEHACLTYIQADLNQPADIRRIFERVAVSHLIHLAWEATPGKFWQAPENFTWVSSSVSLLGSFIRHGGKKAVLAGSCAEYKWENKTLVEETSAINPTTRYSVCKTLFKNLAETMAKNIDLVWARVFFPYGPGEDESKLVSYIFREISEGRLPIFGAPDRAVDFIFIEDVAAAFEALASQSATGTVNICSGRAFLPHEIALEWAGILEKPEIVAKLTAKSRDIERKTQVLGDRQKLDGASTEPTNRPLKAGLLTYVDRPGETR